MIGSRNQAPWVWNTYLSTIFINSILKLVICYLRELDDWFDQKSVLSSVMALESTLLNSANGLNYKKQLKILEISCYKEDFDFSKLKCHLSLLANTVKLQVSIPSIKKVTSIRTICDAMKIYVARSAQTSMTVLNYSHHYSHNWMYIFCCKACSHIQKS